MFDKILKKSVTCISKENVYIRFTVDFSILLMLAKDNGIHSSQMQRIFNKLNS